MLINRNRNGLKRKECIVQLLTKLFVARISVPHDNVLYVKYKLLCRDHIFHIVSSVLWWLTLIGNP